MMPAQQVPQYPIPIGYSHPDYLSVLPLGTPQRLSFDSAPALGVRGAEDIGPTADYPPYAAHQYSPNFNPSHYAYPSHTPSMPSPNGHSPEHHHTSSSTGVGP